MSYSLENMVIVFESLYIHTKDKSESEGRSHYPPTCEYIYILTTQNVKTMALVLLTYTILNKMLHTWYHQYNINLAIYFEMYILTSTS